MVRPRRRRRRLSPRSYASRRWPATHACRRSDRWPRRPCRGARCACSSAVDIALDGYGEPVGNCARRSRPDFTAQGGTGRYAVERRRRVARYLTEDDIAFLLGQARRQLATWTDDGEPSCRPMFVLDRSPYGLLPLDFDNRRSVTPFGAGPRNQIHNSPAHKAGLCCVCPTRTARKLQYTYRPPLRCGCRMA